MKILITVPWAERLGGAEEMLWAFLRRIDRTRMTATVVFFEDGPFRAEVAAAGIATVVVPTSRLRSVRQPLRAVVALARLLRKEQPDVVVNWVAKAQLLAGLSGAMAGMSRRVVWWQHSITTGHWMDRLATLVPACAVGCSSSPAAAAQQRIWPRRATFVVHPGIEVGDLPSEGRAELRRQLGLPPGGTIIGVLGRLQPNKGQHRLLHMLVHLRDRGLDTHGLIVGGSAHGLSTDYEPYLSRLVGELDLADRVTMTGQVADPEPYLRAMDVMVCTSDAEAFGIALVEAMAQEVPVVALGNTGPSEIIEPEFSGLFAPSPEPSAFAAVVGRLVAAPALRRRLGTRGRARVLATFTADRMTERLHDELETIVRSRMAAR